MNIYLKWKSVCKRVALRRLALVVGPVLPRVRRRLTRRGRGFPPRCSRSPAAAAPSPWRRRWSDRSSPHPRPPPCRGGGRRRLGKKNPKNKRVTWRRTRTHFCCASSVSGVIPGCFPKKKLDHQCPESCLGSPVETDRRFYAAATRKHDSALWMWTALPQQQETAVPGWWGMTSPLYSELPQELLLDVEPMRPAGGGRLARNTETREEAREDGDSLR